MGKVLAKNLWNITGHRRGFPRDIIYFLRLENPSGTCAAAVSYHGSSSEAGTGPVSVSRPFSVEKTVSKTVSDSGIIYEVIPYIISDFISGNCAYANPRTYAHTCMHGRLFPAGFSNRRDVVNGSYAISVSSHRCIGHTLMKMIFIRIGKPRRDRPAG